MKNKKLKMGFSLDSAKRSVLAFLLILSLLSVAGCENGGTSGQTSEAPSKSQTTSSTQSDHEPSSEPEDSASSENSAQASGMDWTDGKFTYSGKIQSTSERDDAGEEKAPRNCSNLNVALSGYADAEADALRESILNAGNTESYYKITGTKYYISPGGSDANNGTSPATAFRTVDGLNNIGLEEGDAVLFERNSIFRLSQSISTAKGVTYGSYGEGDKPKILASPANFAKAVWKPSKKKNVWQTQYLYDEACNVVFDHGAEVGCRRTSLRDLTENTYFYQDNTLGVMQIYCDKGNPAAVYKSIEIAPKTFCVSVPVGINNVVIDNLCLKYAGWGGIDLKGQNIGITITNCEIGYIGGASAGSVRLGNGIGNWQGCKDCVWERNWIYQTFDIAISPQGFIGDKYSYENISISNNLMEYNDGDIEFWDDKSTFKNYSMDNNIMRFTSLGWGTRLNDAGIRGIEGCFVAHTQDLKLINLSCKNNIIDCPGRQIINWNMSIAQLPEMDISGTRVFVKSAYRTTPQVIRYFRRSESDKKAYDATNQTELSAAMKAFDPSALVEWHD